MLVTGAIDATTVGAVVALLSTQVGVSGEPKALITASVVALKIGLNELCRGYESPKAPAKEPSGEPRDRRRQRVKPR
jgi:hypothetical protein